MNSYEMSDWPIVNGRAIKTGDRFRRRSDGTLAYIRSIDFHCGRGILIGLSVGDDDDAWYYSVTSDYFFSQYEYVQDEPSYYDGTPIRTFDDIAVIDGTKASGYVVHTYATTDTIRSAYDKYGAVYPAKMFADRDGDMIKVGVQYIGEDGTLWKVTGFEPRNAPYIVKVQQVGDKSKLREVKAKWMSRMLHDSQGLLRADCRLSGDDYCRKYGLNATLAGDLFRAKDVANEHRVARFKAMADEQQGPSER